MNWKIEEHVLKLNEYLTRKLSAEKKIAYIEKFLKKHGLTLSFLSSRDSLNSLAESAASDTGAVLAHMVTGGVDINRFTEMTDLIYNRKHDVIEAFLANGFNPNAYDESKDSSPNSYGIPLWFHAVLNADEKALALFFKYQADPNLGATEESEFVAGDGILAVLYEITSDDCDEQFLGTKHDETKFIRLLHAHGVSLKYKNSRRANALSKKSLRRILKITRGKKFG